ncbi:hypothetical protein TRVL_10134 [Trypanosoma vivax]|nr:hypothetical protein TRVL_10134 [Trypanosoma vivax]
MPTPQESTDSLLWEALGVLPSDAAEQQPLMRRLVVVGDPLCGKRTLVSRLLLAAVQKFPPSSTLSMSPILTRDETSSASTRDGNGNEKRDASGCDSNPCVVCSHADAMHAGANTGGCSQCSAIAQRIEPSGTRTSTGASISLQPQLGVDSPHLVHFEHGIGIAHAFILQRVSLNFSSATGLVDDLTGGRGIHGAHSCEGIRPISANAGGYATVARRVLTEFYCCDSPGVLSMALPSVEALETSVVLVVVDGSAPWRVHDQLQRWYNNLNAHTAQILRAELPKQDEVRRMRMMEQQRRFWSTREEALAPVREWLCENECGGCADISSPLVLDCNTSPLRTLLVCSKTDELEKLSREVEKLQPSRGTEVSNGGATARLSARFTFSPSFSDNVLPALRAARMTLMEFVSQMLRKEAIERQSGFVGIGSTVNTTATTCDVQLNAVGSGCHLPTKAEDITAERVPSKDTYVHPFYRGLWSFAFDLLYGFPNVSSKRDGGQAAQMALTLPDDASELVSARLHPYAFLPHGVDHASLLSPRIASSEFMRLNQLFSGASGTSEGSGKIPLPSGRGGESCIVEGALSLREDCFRQIEELLAANTPDSATAA